MSNNTNDDDYPLYPFFDLTRNQKLAIINFLSVIAASDVRIKNSKIESAFISDYYKYFGVTGDQYLAYISIEGRTQTIADIRSMSKINLQYLVYATTELCVCDGNLNEDEFKALIDWLNDIGISIEEWNDYLENPII